MERKTRLGPLPLHCAQAVAPRSPRAAFSAVRETSLIGQNCSAEGPPAWGGLFGVGESKLGKEKMSGTVNRNQEGVEVVAPRMCGCGFNVRIFYSNDRRRRAFYA